MTHLQLHIPVQFTVPAIEPLYATNIFLQKEHEYTFDVPGKQTWKDGERLGNISPDGITKWYFKPTGMQYTLREPQLPWYALLGCVGKGKAFLIGSHRENFRPDKEGELICFANDSLWFGGYFYRHNNSGSLTVTITRTR
jgi:hypothetical protein